MDNNISKEHYRKYIDRCDEDIFDYCLFEPKIIKCKCGGGDDNEYKLIIGEKYKSLQEKYPFIVNTFFDMLFPQFLREIWYNNKRKTTN